jgi:hypothetical protein
MHLAQQMNEYIERMNECKGGGGMFSSLSGLGESVVFISERWNLNQHGRIVIIMI